mmetsp:Transcript_15862/g.23731  ORF Transcript_15862/g.23731 Transcript_15862/m.23731 type:complete len:285 (+) Transcript_15862:156-1010(+)
MFLNPASSSIFNENTTSSSSTSFRSSKNENAAPLGMKTPHNNNAKNSSNNVKKSGQTTQRRRRALGDISNKGGSAAKATGKNGSGGGLALKPLSTNNQGLRSNNSSKNRQVKFSKSGSGIKSGKSSSSSSSKPQQKKQSSSEYDGIFGVTTRWSNTNLDHDRPSPFAQLPKDEFELSNNVAEEIRQHRLKERVRKEEVEEKRMEERLRLKNDVLFDCSTNGVEDDLQQLLTDHCNIVEDEEEQDALWELKTSPAWEEEDDVEEFDPTKERRLSGTDPISLWVIF